MGRILRAYYDEIDVVENEALPQASLSPKCSEQEELTAESGSLLPMSERVSRDLRVLGQINFL